MIAVELVYFRRVVIGNAEVTSVQNRLLSIRIIVPALFDLVDGRGTATVNHMSNVNKQRRINTVNVDKLQTMALKFFVTTSLCLVVLCNAQMGGWSDVDVNRDDVKSMAQFAFGEVDKASNSLYASRLDSIISARTQVKEVLEDRSMPPTTNRVFSACE